MYIGLHVKYPLFWPDFNVRWIFSTDSRKILVSALMKIRPVTAVLFHAARQTEGQTWRSWGSFFAIVRTRLKMHGTFLPFPDSVLWHPVSCFIIQGSEELIISYVNETTSTYCDYIERICRRVIITCFQRWSEISTDTDLNKIARWKQMWHDDW